MKSHLWLCAVGMIFVVAGVAQAQQAKSPDSPFNKDPWPLSTGGPVKVYILAGQSNMQGHAALRTLEYLIYNKETAKEYEHWKDRYGDWYQRSDVWITTTDGNRFGNLKPGYGASERVMGPELGFGEVIGEHHKEQVLLIKTCWGGRSVKQDFLPPSAAMPSEEVLQEQLARARKKRPETTMEDIKAKYGKAYRDMIATVKDVLGNMKDRFPKYDEKRGYELAGFVFFQGWNDMIDGSQKDEKYATYTQRLGLLVKDVRKDLGSPNLPVVIGELGAGGTRGDFQAAQKAVTELPGLKGNVGFAKTCEYWEPEVEKILNSGEWNSPKWMDFYNVGSERGYHYLGTAKLYTNMGKAFAREMIKTSGKQK